MPVPAALAALVAPRVEPPAAEWLESALASLVDPLDGRRFRAEWARAGRRVGSRAIEPSLAEVDRLRAEGLWPIAGWGLDELARAALLCRALAVSPSDTHLALLRSLYLRGTIRERQALLRALARLPDPGRFVELAAEATQTHVVSVFEALALDNPYPARWLPRPLFDQMVRKALALRLPRERVLGLAERAAAGAPATARAGRPTAHATLPALLAP